MLVRKGGYNYTDGYVRRKNDGLSRRNDDGGCIETDESGNISAVLNKSSGVFHLSQDCYHAKRMKEENRQIIKAADIGDFIGKGYKPCGVCSAKYFDKETSEDDK